jgi:hypothetical protein
MLNDKIKKKLKKFTKVIQPNMTNKNTRDNACQFENLH